MRRPTLATRAWSFAVLLATAACGAERSDDAGSAGTTGSPDGGGGAAGTDATVESGGGDGASAERRRIILDTDANNELDDQHAIAYALFGSDDFELEAITVNRTVLGGGIDAHVAEAERVVRLCAANVPVFAGADGDFTSIKDSVFEPAFDGQAAVDFIIGRALATNPRRLTLVAIGKLTNVALALHKNPSISGKLSLVWLGSNWPDGGEYNLVNDEPAVSYVVDSGVELTIAVVRYGAGSGTDAVRVDTTEIEIVMPGLGPHVDPPVPGRSGGSFSNFGDYSVELFRVSGSATRALFDVAALAAVRNSAWARATALPAPQFLDGRWSERSGVSHTVTFFDSFDRDLIVADFYDSMRHYVLPL